MPTTPSPPGAGPLSGVRVVDSTAMLLGPLTTLIMAQLGAEVVKVEPPAGDPVRFNAPGSAPGLSATFTCLNHGKRSLVLDLKTPAGRAALGRVVASADVFIHNLSQRAASQLQLGYDAIRAHNDRIIYCAATSYGQAGPYASQPSYEDTIQAISGLTYLQGIADGEPGYIRSIVVDKAVGLVAAYAVIAALFARERTGQGQAIEVPMFESMVSLVLLEQMGSHAFEPPAGARLYDRPLSPHRRPYRTADGYIAVLPYSDRNWQAAWGLLGREDLAADPRFGTLAGRTPHIVELQRTLGQELAKHPTRWLFEHFKAAQIPVAPVNSIDDLFEDPHLDAVGMFTMIPDGRDAQVRQVRGPVRFSQTPARTQLSRAPGLGQHSLEVLKECGLDDLEISALVADGGTRAGGSAPD
jgi:crotonobetainyl-CoA:carnitine CoA-transferase CaiB-like acyl-CoA transferase